MIAATVTRKRVARRVADDLRWIIATEGAGRRPAGRVGMGA